MEKLATFQVKNSLVVVDPCYKQDLHLEVRLKARAGEWVAFTDNGNSIIARHSDYKHGEFKEIGEAGVDSGQLGIWDADFWTANNNCNDYNEVGKWYRNICDLTLKNGGGKYGEGLVCDTGGDGCFPVEVIYDGDEIIAVRVTFMAEEIDEDDNF